MPPKPLSTPSLLKRALNFRDSSHNTGFNHWQTLGKKGNGLMLSRNKKTGVNDNTPAKKKNS